MDRRRHDTPASSAPAAIPERDTASVRRSSRGIREIHPGRDKRVVYKPKPKAKRESALPELTTEDVEEFEAFRAFRNTTSSRVQETLGTRRGRRPRA